MSYIIKKIHYCWFGGNPLPESAVRCIDSWKEYLPDFDIIEWNEDNFDVNCCNYCRQAYDLKKWAFVSDFARFKILYEEGGLYFDTDVEVIKSLTDLLEKGSFMGCEENSANRKKGLNVATGLGLYAVPGLELYKEILNYYMGEDFINIDGGANLETVVTRVTSILERHGFDKKSWNKVQEVDNIYIYPPDYFCPIDYATGSLGITENTRTIHHFDGSWHGERERFSNEFRLRLNKFLPAGTAAKVAFALSFIRYLDFKGIIKYVKDKGDKKR